MGSELSAMTLHAVVEPIVHLCCQNIGSATVQFSQETSYVA